MWLWQLKNIHKRHLLWLKLFGVCFFFHSAFLTWMFFIYQDSAHTIALSLNKHIDYSAPILFVPLSTPTIQKETLTTIKTTQQPANTQKAVATKSSSYGKVTADKQNTTPTTTIAPTKKTATTPKVTTQKEDKQKTEVPKPAIIDSKKETEKLHHNSHKPKQQPITTSAQTPQKQLEIPENAHVSHDYREVEALRRTALLQKELTTHWSPPIGMPPTATCELAFTVTSNGSVKDITVIRSSGIMMYDLSARHALFAMKMPQWTYGKTITINFAQ